MVEKIKLGSLSKDVVKTMMALSKNEGIARLLVNHEENPFENPVGDNKVHLANPKSELCKIFPYPFDTTATENQGVSIRVYYNNGTLNENEVISEMQLHIDIIVSKDLWLINNGEESMIRPYEIMSRVVETIGRKGVGSAIRLDIDGWQHLSVNTKIDAIRIYCENFSVET